MIPKNVICLRLDGTAEEVERLYAKTFPDSSVGSVLRAPGDCPNSRQGLGLTVESTVIGVACLALNKGPQLSHSEAFSFQVLATDQAATDRCGDALVRHGGIESECGRCKDRVGVS
jgi:2-polyprenyl-6-hydroxyphenyl methylase/3-demethylubiquinone-9 3-methyltransferase